MEDDLLRDSPKIILRSERWIIREFRKNEEALYFDLFTDDRLTSYLPRRTDDEILVIFKNIQTEYGKAEPLGKWAACTPDDDLIGFIMLIPDEQEQGTAILGYSLHYRYWNKGLATEMSKAIINYGFNVAGVSRIKALTIPENTASVNVLVKSGMKKTNTITRNGEALDIYTMSK